MAQYTFNKLIDPAQLHSELLVLPGFDGLSVSPTSVTCLFINELSNADQLTLNNLIDAHDYASSPTVIRRKVRKAKDLFEVFIEEFITENNILGIVEANKLQLICEAMQPVCLYGQNSYIAKAKSELQAIQLTPEMDPFLNEARKTVLVQRLTDIENAL
jgi:hypothetical protein